MGYLYETHLHTCTASKCGKSTGKEHARFYKEIGYTGIIMTDHFFGGNTAVDRELPWEDRIDWFWRGYEEAKEEGDRIGLDVFFGLEQNYGWDEYLIYGLTKEYMKNHPEMEHWTRKQQLEEVHKAGGCVIQAHPFRIRGYMLDIKLGYLYCDGIEAANAGNEALDDARAMILGRERNMVMTAGSDNHCSPAHTVYGIELEKRLTSIQDYVKIIMERGTIHLHVPEARFQLAERPVLDERHKAFLLNEQEQVVPAQKEWID
ncbi:MAG: PHP domain-containing protein [Clostridia bacterium]|nr:PHP domain-containing protein [Clostridia bacterium]